MVVVALIWTSCLTDSLHLFIISQSEWTVSKSLASSSQPPQLWLLAAIICSSFSFDFFFAQNSIAMFLLSILFLFVLPPSLLDRSMWQNASGLSPADACILMWRKTLGNLAEMFSCSHLAYQGTQCLGWFKLSAASFKGLVRATATQLFGSSSSSSSSSSVSMTQHSHL